MPSRHDAAGTAGVFDRNQWQETFTYDFICASADLRPRLRAIAVDGSTAASDTSR